MKQQFLLELAGILEKHKAAICSRTMGEHTHIRFQFNGEYNIDSPRCHITAYDLKAIASSYVSNLEKENRELKAKLINNKE